MGSRLRALVERLLPWYDAAEAARHDRRTEAIRQRSIRARMAAERLRGFAARDQLGSYGRVRIQR